MVWKFTIEKLGLKLDQIQETLIFLQTNRIQIAKDNLIGQCTTGHSCKDKAKEELQRIISTAAGSPKKGKENLKRTSN